MRPRVLIIGSGGMLGCDLCQGLSGSYEVCGADLVVRRSSFVVRSFKLDITNSSSVGAVVKKAAPDIVINTAAWTDVDGCERDPKKAYRINSQGAKNVAIACSRSAAALIYISTDFVFNGSKRTPYKESDKPAPLGVYADSKFLGEDAVRKILKDYFIIRTSWLYGRCGKNFVDTIICKAKTEPVLRVVNDQVGSPTYTKDLSLALHALLDKIFTSDEQLTTNDASGIYHVSNSGSVSWYEYAKSIVRMSGLRTKVDPISSEELGRPAKRPAMSALDCSKFEKFTGFKMRGWKSALKDYLKN